MAEQAGGTASFVGSIPQHYDSGLGPNIFVDYADDIAARAAALQPGHVLELAAGTGIVSRKLRDALPKAAKLTVTDLNPPMLEVAAAKFRPGEAVELKPADATALPFADQSFDLIVCQFGVMFFPDKDKGYREAHRVLKPGGRYLFNVWDTHAYNPFGRIVHETVAGFFTSDPPMFMKAPFSYRDLDPIKDSLLKAGFDELAFFVIGLNKRIVDIDAFARGGVFGSPLVDQIKARGTADPDRVVEAVAAEFRKAFGDPGTMPLQAMVISARRPGPAEC
jgi:ubiquinone/menaquinone biosynthesis C-methylase UbiE